LVLFALPVLLLIVAALVLIPPWQRKEPDRSVLLPRIESMASTMFRSNRQIFDEAMEAEKYLPNDPTLAKLFPSIANTAPDDLCKCQRSEGLPAGTGTPSSTQIHTAYFQAPAEDEKFNVVRHERA
jgi:hypothetical protein